MSGSRYWQSYHRHNMRGIMQPRLKPNAVIAIRVGSTTRARVRMVTFEAQREQLLRYAETHNIHVKEQFVFLESGSKRKSSQCNKPSTTAKTEKNNIQYFIIKSIDRFTRGGGSPMTQLKLQLENSTYLWWISMA